MPFSLRTACRLCGGDGLRTVLAYGDAPVADRLVDASIRDDDVLIPLTLCRCDACSLLQLAEAVDPRFLFGVDYPYFSSASSTWLDRCRAHAASLVERFDLGPRSLVVEIASNDGYLLRNFVRAGVPVLGVDPAPAPVEQACRDGITTRCDFFDGALGAAMAAEGVDADVVIANNVLAHVPDPVDFIAGVSAILKPGGVLVVETGYAADLVNECVFDTVYHQHQSYFSLATLTRLLSIHGLSPFDAERVPTQGGSLRVYAGRDRPPTHRLVALQRTESRVELEDSDTLERFADHARQRARQIHEQILARVRSGGRVVAYGAAAKGTTLLHFCRLDSSMIDYVVDRNPFKQGKRMPGCGLTIHDPERLLADPPDYVLLLPWNLCEEVAVQLSSYLAAGGRLIVPLPECREVAAC